jgi:hypothetical protein
MAHLPSSSLDRAINYDYTHPELYYNGLILAPENDSKEIHRERKNQGILGKFCRHPNQELCWSRGWSIYTELTSSYGSRVKIMHVCDNIGVWAIGSQWLLRSRGYKDQLEDTDNSDNLQPLLPRRLTAAPLTTL